MRGSPRGRRRSVSSGGAVPGPRGQQGAEHGLDRDGPVEHEEVDARSPGGEELLALARRVGDPEGALGLLVAPQRLELLVEELGDLRVADAAEPVQPGARDDRQDPGDDGDVDAGLAHLGEPVEVDLVVEEELADQELGAGLDLLAQIGDVGLGGGGLGVDLGVAGGADPEPARRLEAADEGRELGRAGEAAGRRGEVLLAARRVAAQGEDVLDARVGEAPQGRLEPLDRLADHAQVSHRLDPVLLLDPRRHLDGAVTGGPGGPVGDRDEPRIEPVQVLDAREQRGGSLLGLRGEELEGEAGFGAAEDLGDAHLGIVDGAGWRSGGGGRAVQGSHAASQSSSTAAGTPAPPGPRWRRTRRTGGRVEEGGASSGLVSLLGFPRSLGGPLFGLLTSLPSSPRLGRTGRRSSFLREKARV